MLLVQDEAQGLALLRLRGDPNCFLGCSLCAAFFGVETSVFRALPHGPERGENLGQGGGGGGEFIFTLLRRDVRTTAARARTPGTAGTASGSGFVLFARLCVRV